MTDDKIDPAAGKSLNDEAKEHPRYDNPRDPFASPDRLPPGSATATVFVPSGYETAEEFAQDCGFELAPAGDAPSPAGTAPGPSDATLFVCDEAACKEDPMFYEIFVMDDRWDIIRAILAAAPQAVAPAETEDEYRFAHEAYCNANRKLPVGCDGCSCRAGREIKRLRAQTVSAEGLKEAMRLYDRMKDERDAALASVEEMRKGIQDYLAGDYENSRKHRTEDLQYRCEHGQHYWEDCGQCIDAHFQAVLDTTALPSTDKTSEDYSNG